MGSEILSAPTPVGTHAQPDFENQEATRYRTNLDNMLAAHQRLAGAFAPQEGGPLYAFDPADVDIGTDKITWTGLPLADQAVVKFENDQAGAGDPPAPLVVGTSYYIEAPGANDFQLETSIGAGAVNFTDTGSGKHLLVPQPLMKVWVGPGFLFDGSSAPTEVAGQFTAAFTAPVTNPRIDLVQIDAATGVVGVTAGAEAASPVAPALPAGKLPVALVSLLVSTTAISNQELTDVRALGVMLGYTPEDPANKGAASGYASLNGSSKVVEEPASKAQASGIASLDASSVVVQPAPSVREAGGNNLKPKVIDIGDWDMDATASVTIAHGLTGANIRGVSATIRSDDDATRYQLPGSDSAGALHGSIRNDGTNIYLIRTTSGFFDGVLFDATGYNRGWIVVWYVP